VVKGGSENQQFVVPGKIKPCEQSGAGK